MEPCHYEIQNVSFIEVKTEDHHSKMILTVVVVVEDLETESLSSSL